MLNEFVCNDGDLADIDSEVMTLAVEILAQVLRKRGWGERLELVVLDDGSGHIRLLTETLPVDYSGVIVDIDTPSDLAAWVDAEHRDNIAAYLAAQGDKYD